MVERYYAFPDIHGMNDLLQLALQFVYGSNPNGGKIIFLGDYIDRGHDNKGVLDTVMNPPANWEFICLKGNHEDMFVHNFDSAQEYYDRKVVKEIHPELPKYVEWMRNLKLNYFEGDNVFAHAYYDDNVAQECQSDVTAMWLRVPDNQAFFSKDDRLYLTHGHTPRSNGPLMTRNRTNLDCGAVFYGRYVIAEYHKGVKGPVAFHSITKD